jgi:ribose 5-phosphate isomerase RpiB
MADTTYNSLGVDEVAAQHANAHCVVRHCWTGLGTAMASLFVKAASACCADPLRARLTQPSVEAASIFRVHPGAH